MSSSEAAVTHPNREYLNFRGAWTVYCLIVGAIHLFFLSLEFLSTEWSWTLTVVAHSVITFFVFHVTKGVPWLTVFDETDSDKTVWEQLDDGLQLTPTRKFLIVVPIVLFFLDTFYTHHDNTHFLINVAALLGCLLPKLEIFFGVRLFNINKY